MQTNATHLFKISALAALIMVSGCSQYQSIEQLQTEINEVQTPEKFSDVEFSTGEPVAMWWTQLHDESLVKLIDQALVKNHSLAIAQASLSESQALLRVQQQDQWPQVQAQIAAQRQKTSADIRTAGAPAITETYQGGFTAAWELDLFGSVVNQVKAAKATLAAREANLRAVRVSVSSEVAHAYLSLRGAQHQREVAKDNIVNLRKTLSMTQRLLDIGRGNQFDVSRAQTQLAITEASLPQLEFQISQALNRLSVLTGEYDESLRNQLAEVTALPSMPTLSNIGTPRELIRRRPDIEQAEQELIGAVARYNVSVADLYPRITFNGGFGYLSTDLDRLGETPTETFNIGPSIHWAAFDLGRVKANIRAADARAQAKLAEFEQRVLLALEETDNALQSFSREEQRRSKLFVALQASENSLSIAQKKYELGAENFLSVLDAERARLDVSAQLAQSETKVLQDLIAVYKSLSGGVVNL